MELDGNMSEGMHYVMQNIIRIVDNCAGQAENNGLGQGNQFACAA